MSGRGDNNKHGSARRGASNRSNQPFINEEKTENADAHRDTGIPGESSSTVRTDERTFNLLVDDVPYVIKASPFSFNEEIRYYINVNDGSDHVFTWDSELKMLRAIDTDAAILPGALEEAISQKLQSQQK